MWHPRGMALTPEDKKKRQNTGCVLMLAVLIVGALGQLWLMP